MDPNQSPVTATEPSNCFQEGMPEKLIISKLLPKKSAWMAA
jgi:hypothetical protein